MRPGWFGPKRFGFGVSPRSWQGWAVTIVFLAILAASMRWLRPLLEERTGASPVIVTSATVAIWLMVFLVIVALTYGADDPPRRP